MIIINNFKLIIICIFIVLLLITFILFYNNSNKFDNSITSNNITVNSNNLISDANDTSNIININNMDSTKKSLSVNAKWEDANLKEELDFLNNLYIPDNLKEIRQGKVYVKSNIADNNYSEFRQYSIMFTDSSEEEIKNIELVFSNKKLLDDCIPVGLENADASIIDGVDVKIFVAERVKEPTLISGEAYFEYNNNNYDFKCYRITQEEFIKVISSLIYEIKK